MKKLLLTAFEPFGGRASNRSAEAVAAMPGSVGEYEIKKLVLPVEFGTAALIAEAEARELGADAVLCVGEAGGRSEVSPELVAINLRYARIPDNAGFAPVDKPVIPGGENALFSTAPARKIAEAIGKLNIPARLSLSAGSYVCNDLFYSLLSAFSGDSVKVGFIHVPAGEELSGYELKCALMAAIEAL